MLYLVVNPKNRFSCDKAQLQDMKEGQSSITDGRFWQNSFLSTKKAMKIRIIEFV